MPYLTYEEYNDLGFNEIDNTEFDKLNKKASGVLDYVTRYFYKHQDLKDDVDFRKEQFKLALAAQIEYFNDIGAASTHEINNPLNVQIGRTQVGMGANNQKEANRLVSSDVYMYLSGTGLLYRGLGVRS